MKKALPRLGPGPFLIHNSDSVLDRGRRLQSRAAAAAWDDRRMDCLMLLALASASHGYQGRGDFALDADGRIRRREGAGDRAVRLHRRLDAHPAPVRGSPDGAFSLNVVGAGRSRPDAPTALRMEGMWMHVGTPEALAHAELASRRAIAVRATKEGGVPPARGIYTVPPGRPFLTALRRGAARRRPAVGGPRPGPLQLADVTLLLPTRRGDMALQEAFLEASDGAALLLPKHQADHRLGRGPRPARERRGPRGRCARAGGGHQRDRSAADARQAGAALGRGERGGGSRSQSRRRRRARPRSRQGWRASLPG